MSNARVPATFEDAFRGNRAYLVDKISPSVHFWNFMLDKGILSSQHIEECRQLPTDCEKVDRLLTHLTRCDDSLVGKFFEVLELTNQKHVVKQISVSPSMLRQAADNQCVRPNVEVFAAAPHPAHVTLQLERNAGCSVAVNTVDQARPHSDPAVLQQPQSVGPATPTSGSNSSLRLFNDCGPEETAVKTLMDTAPSSVLGRSSGGDVAMDVDCTPQNVMECQVEMDCSSMPDDGRPVPNSSCGTSGPPAAINDVPQSSGNVEGVAGRSPEQPQTAASGSRGEEIQLREYQKELAMSGIEGHNLIICAPTGSGKTYTAGYICRQRRTEAVAAGRRFKAIFIVCIRNLVAQQTIALSHIIGADVRGADDKLALSVLSQYADVVVATAQLLVNELRSNAMKITDLDLIIMDECHHTDLGHSYTAIMEAYYKVQRSGAGAGLPQIVGLTASLGVGSSELRPEDHYVRICANLDCDVIAHVRKNKAELESFVPRLKRDRIDAVEPRNRETPFCQVIMAMMSEILETMKAKSDFEFGCQPFENWAVGVRNDADTREDSRSLSEAADALIYLNLSLMVYSDLRTCDALCVLEDRYALSTPRCKLHDVYSQHCDQLREIVHNVVVEDNPKLVKLCELLSMLYSTDDARGILLTRTRYGVEKLVKFIESNERLSAKVTPAALLGQSAMTDVQQKDILNSFRLGRDDPRRCNLLVATDVAQEGLDMPRCNFVIRYDFVSNEIGSVQSKGRARARDSESYLIVERGSRNEQRELENIEREKRMMAALDKFDQMAPRQRHEMIAEQRTRFWSEVESRDERRRIKASQFDPQDVTIHCRTCKRRLCSAVDMRVRGSNYICVDEDFINSVEVVPELDQKDFRTEVHLGSVLCGAICRQKLGLQLRYKSGRRLHGYVLGKDKVMWKLSTEKEYRAFKQWSKVPFRIDKDSNC